MDTKLPPFVPGIRVLVADDDRNHSRLMRVLLQSEGYEVTEAHTGEIACDEMEQFHPTLVILDSMLPQRSGRECLQHIKNHPTLSQTLVVMCSARSDIRYILDCLENGASAFIMKPFENRKFLHQIRHVLGLEPEPAPR